MRKIGQMECVENARKLPKINELGFRKWMVFFSVVVLFSLPIRSDPKLMVRMCESHLDEIEWMQHAVHWIGRKPEKFQNSIYEKRAIFLTRINAHTKKVRGKSGEKERRRDSTKIAPAPHSIKNTHQHNILCSIEWYGLSGKPYPTNEPTKWLSIWLLFLLLQQLLIAVFVGITLIVW